MGFYKEVTNDMPAGGVPFWVLGTLVLIPAIYYIYEVTRACRANTPQERQEILKEFNEYT